MGDLYTFGLSDMLQGLILADPQTCQMAVAATDSNYLKASAVLDRPHKYGRAV